MLVVVAVLKQSVTTKLDDQDLQHDLRFSKEHLVLKWKLENLESLDQCYKFD